MTDMALNSSTRGLDLKCYTTAELQSDRLFNEKQDHQGWRSHLTLDLGKGGCAETDELLEKFQKGGFRSAFFKVFLVLTF